MLVVGLSSFYDVCCSTCRSPPYDRYGYSIFALVDLSARANELIRPLGGLLHDTNQTVATIPKCAKMDDFGALTRSISNDR